MKPKGMPQGSAFKIALLCDWYLPRRGGVEFHLHDLALQLMKQGHHVDVITPTPFCYAYQFPCFFKTSR